MADGEDADRWSMGTAPSHFADEEAPAELAWRPPSPPKLRFPPGRTSGIGAAASAGGIIKPVHRPSGAAACVSLRDYLASCYRWCEYETHAMLFHWVRPPRPPRPRAEHRATCEPRVARRSRFKLTSLPPLPGRAWGAQKSCPRFFNELQYDAQLRHPLIRYNPGYWAIFSMTLPFLLVRAPPPRPPPPTAHIDEPPPLPPFPTDWDGLPRHDWPGPVAL